jgi:hypothetical protein
MNVADEKVFYHFYDMEFGPPTFNFVMQLVSAEMARIETTDCERTCVVFVPGSNQGFNRLMVYGHDVKRWRLWNLLLPVVSLIKANTSYSVLQSREEARHLVSQAGDRKFPIGYTLENAADCPQANTPNLNHGLGFTMPSLRAPELACEYVRRLVNHVCPGKKYVTITSRQATYNVQRNSDIEVWKTIAKYMQQKGYFVFFLPDYEVIFDIPNDIVPDAYVARECVLNLHMRLALYEQASLNLGEGGPMALCYFDDKCNYAINNLIVAGEGHSSELQLMQQGFSIGKDISYYDTFARWVWTRDDALSGISTSGTV